MVQALLGQLNRDLLMLLSLCAMMSSFSVDGECCK